ncbi:hypothetical protein [Rhizobium rhizoryzae]|uniref:hypothetical protein n=1 Tax=Rhizobium rhizoryzae TaxID=451876 RepID=UPI0028A9E68A|nr:hypothetical protein [Rhizobium rhizoryzae]
MLKTYLVTMLAITFLQVPDSSFAATSEGPASKDVFVIGHLATCIGKFDAAKGYETYVNGYADSRSQASIALRNLLSAMQVTDVTFYRDQITKAALEYAPTVIENPLETRRLLESLVGECQLVTAQADALRVGIETRASRAEEVRKAEQQARFEAEKDARQHAFQLEKMRLEAEKQVAAIAAEKDKLVAQTAKETAEAERLRVQELTKEKSFERARTLAQLEKDRADATVKAAQLEKDKADATVKAAELEKQRAQLVAEAAIALEKQKATRQTTKVQATDDDRTVQESAKASLVETTTVSGNIVQDASTSKAGLINAKADNVTAVRRFSAPTNALEAAIAPGYGTKAKWDEMIDSGEHNRSQSFYGIRIDGVSMPMWDDTGVISHFELVIAKSRISAKEIRSHIDRICGSKQDDWQIKNKDGFQFGSIELPGCNFTYSPYDDKRWAISFLGNSKTP